MSDKSSKAAESEQEIQPEAIEDDPETAADQAPGEPEDPLVQLGAERDELQDKVLRLAADLDNYKKRSEREKAEFLRRANERLLADLLPVVDNLERAIEAAQEAADQAVCQGLQMTLAEMLKVLERHGLSKVEALGQPFDPEFHEAVMQQEDPEAEENTVLSQLQTGYLHEGRLLRPAMVVVSKRPDSDQESAEQGDRIEVTLD